MSSATGTLGEHDSYIFICRVFDTVDMNFKFNFLLLLPLHYYLVQLSPDFSNISQLSNFSQLSKDKCIIRTLISSDFI